MMMRSTPADARVAAISEKHSAVRAGEGTWPGSWRIGTMCDMEPATATASPPAARSRASSPISTARRLMASNSPPSPAGSSMIRFDA